MVLADNPPHTVSEIAQLKQLATAILATLVLGRAVNEGEKWLIRVWNFTLILGQSHTPILSVVHAIQYPPEKLKRVEMITSSIRRLIEVFFVAAFVHLYAKSRLDLQRSGEPVKPFVQSDYIEILGAVSAVTCFYMAVNTLCMWIANSHESRTVKI